MTNTPSAVLSSELHIDSLKALLTSMGEDKVFRTE